MDARLPDLSRQPKSRAGMIATALVGVALGTACNRAPSAEPPPVQDTLSVYIDGGESGAPPRAPRDGASATDPAKSPEHLPRTLAFEMAGVARADAKQAEAARQAAVVEAFAQALIEARRLRRQPTTDFTARLGPRLTVIHRSLGDGCEIEVSLTHRGEEIRFEVKRGVLQHEPRNPDSLARLFDETNGEFALLETRWLPSGDECIARVACFRPAGMGTLAPETIAGHPDDEPPIEP